jgi:hypothetical protein
MYFNGSQFQVLKINGLGPWLKSGQNFQIDGLSYSSIAIPDWSAKPPEMGWLAMINASPYTPQAYAQLEDFLRDHVSPDYADKVYFSMRRRERQALPWVRGFFDWVQDWLLGYGRALWRAGLLVAFLICVGAVLFRKHRMEHEDDSSDDWYNSFWFSLDLLSPVDLGVASRWRAKNHLLRNYAQVHRVAGWILIPLIAAAVTGIIK